MVVCGSQQWSESSGPTTGSRRKTSPCSHLLKLKYLQDCLHYDMIKGRNKIMTPFTFSFKRKDETGEHDDGDGYDDEDETQVFISLV